MHFIKTIKLPVTKYRPSLVTTHSYKLDNGMLVDIVDAPFGISTVFCSTQLSEHSSIECAQQYLEALGNIQVFENARIDFSIVREFSENYVSKKQSTSNLPSP